MEKNILLEKLTGEKKPLFMTDREKVIFDKCLNIINDLEAQIEKLRLSVSARYSSDEIKKAAKDYTNTIKKETDYSCPEIHLVYAFIAGTSFVERKGIDQEFQKGDVVEFCDELFYVIENNGSNGVVNPFGENFYVRNFFWKVGDHVTKFVRKPTSEELDGLGLK